MQKTYIDLCRVSTAEFQINWLVDGDDGRVSLDVEDLFEENFGSSYFGPSSATIESSRESEISVIERANHAAIDRRIVNQRCGKGIVVVEESCVDRDCHRRRTTLY